MPAVNERMLIDAVDRTDTPIGTVRRRDVFELQSNFRVVHDLVFNRRGDLLLQQVAETRTRHPGYWGSSVAGYVFAGESYEAAAKRRIRQELGIRSASLDFVGKTSMDDEGCRKFIAVFSTTRNGPFKFDRTHIERLEFLPIRAIHRLHAAGLRKFTPTFLRVLGFYEDKT
jgi:isopentenyldiphosphate isomerase